MSVALVTGGSGRLGQAVCAELATRGYDVAIHHRTNELGAQQALKLVTDTGRRGEVLTADLASSDIDYCVRHLFDQTRAALGGLDVIVHTAASQSLTPWSSSTAADWDAAHVHTLRPAGALLRAATAHLPAGGCVLLVGSIEGLRPATEHGAYAVAKAGVHHLVAVGAQELGAHDIRVVGVAPGLIDRPGLEHDWPEGVERWRAASALKRTVTAAEVAATIGFLTSPQASALTGVTIPVDAGWSANPGW